ncbi:unnamed protein product, partial [Symbiodinium pilosum]
MAYKEIQEFRKGHQQLHEKLAHQDPRKLGRRHVSRFLSDAYCKGVVRGQVECCNLRATYGEDYAVAAECIRTSSTVSFLGAQYLGLVDQLVEGRAKQARARACRLNKRHSRARRTLQSADVALLYALRPTHPDVWYLSPYELTVYWEIVPTRVPMSRNEADDPTARWDVTLLPGGYEKLCSTAESKIELVPGADFTLARMSCGKILVFDDTPETNQVRHAWLLRRRPRAVCPHFGFCPTPRAQAEHREENARITAVYVHPWTMHSSVAEQRVPLATDVRVTSASWEDALRRWLNGGIFLQRKRDQDEAANSDDAVSDAEVELEAADVQNLFRRSAAGGSGGIEDLEGDAGADTTAELPCLNYDSTAARKAAKRGQQSSKAPTGVGLFEPRREENVLSMEARSIATEVGQWLENVSTRCNAEQHAFLRLVAQRILQEEASMALNGNPLSADT